MIEGWIRRTFPTLQSIYDRAPYPLQNLLTTMRGCVLARIRYQKRFWEHLDELVRRERYSPGEMEAYQEAQLRELVAYGYENVPFYRNAFLTANLSPDDIRTVDDLKKLPVLSRETVRANWQSLVSRAVPKEERIHVFTSGTTGAGLSVIWEKQALVLNWAFRARQRRWAKVNPREWRLTFLGSRVVPATRERPPFWRTNWFEKQVFMSIFHLSETHMPSYVAFLKGHEGWPMEGFPSVLSILSDFMLKERECIPMKAIFTDGEPLYPDVRAKIESAFSSKVYDTYGMTEWAGLIQGCERGNFHLISDFGILEILDEGGNPVPPGREGDFVWTGFVNRGMPLLRYRIGDRGIWQEDQRCACGRPFPLVHPTVTREGDCVTAPDGRILSPRTISPLVRRKSFRVCQFVQESTDSLTVRIVPGNGRAEKDAEDVRRALRAVVGDSIQLSVQWAERPIQHLNGKIPIVISNLGKGNEREVPHR